MAEIHTGGCNCGAVTFEFSGPPEAMGYCHCDTCRAWYAAPVNAFSLWKAENTRVTKGAEHVGTYTKTEANQRQFCRLCGGRVMSRLVGFGMVAAAAESMPTFPYAPTFHLYYGEKVLAVDDDLPKFKDFPTSFGGSGEMVTA